ncbi:MAG: glycosyltransferase family 39 protein [Bacteroidia bacterium]|nr:glycosyltransferase family 39 protein [Bacteroidia bacterium]
MNFLLHLRFRLRNGLQNPLPVILLGSILLAGYFPFFLHLDKLTIRPWDESRNAVNAIEMADGGSLIAPTFDHLPENWNTKPPLLFWLQAGLMQVVGHNELAVRLPSACAGLGICLILLLWGGKLGDSRPAGWLAAVVMMTVSGFFHWHGARQGDFDALLVFFLLVSALSWYEFLHGSPDFSSRYLFLAVVAVGLAVFTKAVAGFFLLPGLFLWTLLQGKLGWVLQQKRLYLYGMGFLLVLALYLSWREMLVPGFLKALNQHELMGRFFDVTENSPGPFSFYFENWWKDRFTPWNYLLPASLLAGLLFARPAQRRLLLYCLVLGGTYLLMVSASKTKMMWYDLPAYPFAALITGLGLSSLIQRILERFVAVRKVQHLLTLLTLLIFVCLSVYPYQRILSKVYFPKEDGTEREQYGRFIHYLSAQRPDLKAYTAINKEYNAGLLFYRHQARIENGVVVGKKMVDKHEFEPGELAFTCYADLLATLQAKYHLRELERKTYPVAFGNRTCDCVLFEVMAPVE